MAGRTDFITDANWEDVWLIWYVLVDDAYEALERHYGTWRRSGPAPIFSDSEVITVALIIDTFFHGHEALGLAFLRRYHPTLFPQLPPDGWFNARRTPLGPLIDQVRRLLSLWLIALRTTVCQRSTVIGSGLLPILGQMDPCSCSRSMRPPHPRGSALPCLDSTILWSTASQCTSSIARLMIYRRARSPEQVDH